LAHSHESVAQSIEVTAWYPTASKPPVAILVAPDIGEPAKARYAEREACVPLQSAYNDVYEWTEHHTGAGAGVEIGAGAHK
jgi:hypothetical protein